ncbi:MAG: PadR family transcriptional regulator [Clostridiales bacterium]|jgi:DNA-binding PadR family transcriptional regulator|nr:PadR family transcriptional regulator [Eubacteriales bacterium]MDH7565634.1 PadR family transcriptional regulator [Clostridiales bacterium]
MFIDIYILSQLKNGPKHGYEIKKNVEYLLGPYYAFSNNRLYPILKKFEKMGAVNKQVKQQEGKPNRHIYHITQTGLDLFYKMLKDYPPEIASNDSEFCVRLCFFHLLDEQSRQDILNKRKEALENQLKHLEKIIADITDKKELTPFSYYNYEFSKSCALLELEMINKLRQI